jgi:hypothetical protein
MRAVWSHLQAWPLRTRPLAQIWAVAGATFVQCRRAH